MEHGRMVKEVSEDSRGGGDFQISKEKGIENFLLSGVTHDWVSPTHLLTHTPRDSHHIWQEQMIACLQLRACFYTDKSSSYLGRAFKVTMTSMLDKTLTMSLLMQRKRLMPEQIKIKVWVQIWGHVALSRNLRFCSAGSCSPTHPDLAVSHLHFRFLFSLWSLFTWEMIDPRLRVEYN